jgi:hypothetical protein
MPKTIATIATATIHRRVVSLGNFMAVPAPEDGSAAADNGEEKDDESTFVSTLISMTSCSRSNAVL